MVLRLQIMLHETLYIRNPELTTLGKEIVKHSVELMYHEGFEAFNFKKLASKIGTTEAGIYRYFESKNQLLKYLTAWYWSWLEYQIQFQTNNLSTPIERLNRLISILSIDIEDDINTSHFNESMMQHLVSRERIRGGGDGDKLLKSLASYIDLCNIIEVIILNCCPTYNHPKALTTTIIEISHYHHYLKYNVSQLCDFNPSHAEKGSSDYLRDLVYACLGLEKKK